ncbi:hypothetical protein J2I47_03385 [Fibrella sp. HMF5335]|uniref:Putative beta-lactamase-inhibitor-like PepSY-like domain-containing protein n=1 Tax=Fibrella rubiginis TaxID=2817060 RepID=A0A939GB17_9BACT|nr:PepSY-like domain-containing protein [Fibrella rubiginis]MBO0935584.1 hypothetical protein [Fibrella rubiginis]
MFQKLLLGAALLAAVAACTQQNVATDPQDDESTAVISSLARLGNPNNATAITGKPCSETVIAKEKVPQAVYDYLAKTYPAYVFVQAEQGTDRDGKTFYEIQFTLDGKKRQLHFDAAGVVLAGPGNGPKGPGGHGPKGTPPLKTDIAADKLPKPITDYMAANFKGYTIVKAEVVTDATTAAVLFYDVRYTLDGKTAEVHFDVNGNLQAPHKGGHGPG